MPFITATTIAAVGLGLAAVGTAVNIKGQQKAAAASKKAERLREKQMNLEAARRRREIVREAQLARSQALAAGVSQGADVGSSGVQGGFAQIAGRAGLSTLQVNQGQDIGAGLFDANADIASGESISSFGKSVQGFGGKLMANADTISANLESYGLFGNKA